MDALRRSQRQLSNKADLDAMCLAELDRHRVYIAEHFEDLPEIQSWRWQP
jgi:xylulose-5-phosphate/fructose-6-phosphate phosphoketolase